MWPTRAHVCQAAYTGDCFSSLISNDHHCLPSLGHVGNQGSHQVRKKSLQGSGETANLSWLLALPDCSQDRIGLPDSMWPKKYVWLHQGKNNFLELRSKEKSKFQIICHLACTQTSKSTTAARHYCYPIIPPYHMFPANISNNRSHIIHTMHPKILRRTRTRRRAAPECRMGEC